MTLPYHKTVPLSQIMMPSKKLLSERYTPADLDRVLNLGYIPGALRPIVMKGLFLGQLHDEEAVEEQRICDLLQNLMGNGPLTSWAVRGSNDNSMPFTADDRNHDLRDISISLCIAQQIGEYFFWSNSCLETDKLLGSLFVQIHWYLLLYVFPLIAFWDGKF